MNRRIEGTYEYDSSVDVEDILDELEALESRVTSERERAEVQRVRRLAGRIPGSRRIEKYTGRDVGESFIGGLVFSLPLLVEDGVFDIAEWFAAFTIGPFPVFLTLNVLFITLVTTALLYVVDFRDVEITDPFFGILPRRLLGVLVISFVCAFGMMFMWGRLHEGDPTAIESFGRATVIWAAAALGAVLADILPGESKGEDLRDLIAE